MGAWEPACSSELPAQLARKRHGSLSRQETLPFACNIAKP